MNPNPSAQDPTGTPPSTPGAAYFDPITGQQVYLDATTGGFSGGPAVEPPVYPPTYPAYPPAATYPPPGYPYPPENPYQAAPGYPPPGYPPPYVSPYGGATPYFYAPNTSTNSMAVGALVMSIIGILTTWCVGIGGLIGAAGAIMGHIAMGQVRSSYQAGRGMALAGVIIGWIALALGLLFFVIEVTAPTT